MKISRLLVLAAFWLGITGTTNAATLTGVWTMPEPQGLEFTTFTDDGTHYYLYNPAAKMFFSSGNSWNTQASLRTFGYPFWLEASAEEDAPAGSYELWNYVENPDRSEVTGNHNLFTDDGGSTWVDHASQGNYSWTFEINGDYVRFQNVALIADKPEYEGTYIGWTGLYDGDKNSSVLKMIVPGTEGTSVDWKAVTEESYATFAASENYTVYVNGVAAYFSARALKAAIEAAEPVYVNVSDAVALYNDPTTTAADMDAATAALKALTELKAKLKAAIEDAEAQGFQATDAYRAVLTNLNATKAEVEQALADLGAALAEWGKTHATWDKPVDMTSKIVNPNFDNASYTGWSGTAPNMTGNGSHGPANVPEKWNDTFDTYQDIADLPAGIYALGAKTMWRGSWNDMVNHIGPAAKLYVKVGDVETSVPFNYAYGPLNTTSYAGSTYFGTSAGEQSYTDEEAGVTYYIPNDPSAFRLYAEAGMYDTKVYFSINEGGVRIGVANPAKLGDADNWSLFDTFTLTYYGNGADACQNYLDSALQNFSEYEIPEGTVYTESYLAAYQAAYSGKHTASNMDEVNAVLNGISNAKAALDKNIALWKEYQELADKASNMVNEEDYEGMDETEELADYLDGLADIDGYPDIIAAHALTNEEIEAEIARMNDWMNTMIEKSKSEVYDGKNMTKFIQNPTFEKDTKTNSGTSEGWTVDRVSGGNVTPGPINGDGNTFLEKVGYYNGCFESWHCHKWDVWQEVKNLPVGMYELQVQGYVRCEVPGYNRGDDLEPDYPSPVYLYMNNALSSFPSVYSEIPAENGVEFTTVESWTVENINGNDFPNSMGGAAQCFHIDEENGIYGMYKTTAYGLIAKEGDTFRIGVKMDKDQDWWCIWDNFKLTYRTPTAELVQPVLEEALKGLKLDQPMGKNIFDQASALNTEAEQAIAAKDGEAMFAVLTKVYDLNAAIIESVALFAKLQEAVDYLDAATAEAVNATAKSDALALCGQINNGIINHEIADEEVEGLMEQMDIAFTKMALPANIDDASDANPIEVSLAIKSASFEKDYENSRIGWNGLGDNNLGNNDEQKAALACEFYQDAFDMNQTIKGLPAGTYELTVGAFIRSGAYEDLESYAAWQADPKSSMALLYAVDGDSTVYTSPIVNVMAGAQVEDPAIDGVEEITIGEEVFYLPNSLVGGKSYIEANEGVYTNKAIVKVKEDGKLTVGMKKAEQKDKSWVVLDDFKLFYLGKNSSQTVSPDLTGIESVEGKAAKVEFFTLDGRKATSAHKGIMIQKVTLSNGTTLIQKIRN